MNEPRATARPDRDEYPAPDIGDFIGAIKRAADDENWSHHVSGRYTAHRTYTELEPDARPGDKLVVIRVESCERDVIADIPEDEVDEFLSAIEAGDRDE